MNFAWLEKILSALLNWWQLRQLTKLGEKEQEVIELKKDQETAKEIMEIKDEQSQVANNRPSDRDDLANRLRNTGL